MTISEAKELFEDNFTVVNTHGHYTKEEEGQAQELAISALSEQKKGEWIDISTGKGIFKTHSVKCSNCRNTLNLDGVNCGRGDANYCPNCGADMRGNTKCKRTPKEGNNESYNSYNCKNWIP